MTAKPGLTNFGLGLLHWKSAYLAITTRYFHGDRAMARKLLLGPSKRPEECSPETFLRLLCFFLAARRHLKLELRFRFLRFLAYRL